LPPAAEFVVLAHRAADAHALWPELVCAIVEQESAWDPWALRYEPEFYEKYVAPQVARGAIDDVTESRARAFSWGLMQVMGQVAREHGFANEPLASLCDPAVGLEIGCRVFAAKLAAAEVNVTRALLLWNGAGNQDLPRRHSRPRCTLRLDAYSRLAHLATRTCNSAAWFCGVSCRGVTFD
jgi:soluble lytic murein transglycosylase-like protein